VLDALDVAIDNDCAGSDDRTRKLGCRSPAAGANHESGTGKKRETRNLSD